MNNDRVIMYNGSTGLYQRKFCDVKWPRGIVFHYEDLYVVSSANAAIYRFNGMTGASRGILATSTLLQSATTFAFDRWTNRSFVAVEKLKGIVEVQAPMPIGDQFSTSESKLWSQTPNRHPITGLDVHGQSLYAVSPYTKGIYSYNRTTGELISFFSMPEESTGHVDRNFDVKVYDGSLYVCGSGGIQIWRISHLLNAHESDRRGNTFAEVNQMVCSFIFIHTTWDTIRGIP